MRKVVQELIWKGEIFLIPTLVDEIKKMWGSLSSEHVKFTVNSASAIPDNWDHPLPILSITVTATATTEQHLFLWKLKTGIGI